MVQRRSFSTASDSDEPVVFDINGVEFHCRAQISSGIILKMGELMGGDEDTLGERTPAKEMIGVIKEFFQHALRPEDRARFFAMLDDPDTPVPLPVLVDITQWLASLYSGNRPTGQNSPPTSDSASPGAGSTGSAGPVASISGNSPLIAASI